MFVQTSHSSSCSSSRVAKADSGAGPAMGHGASVIAWLVATIALCWCVVLVGWSASANAVEGCANEPIRMEQASTFLPDCRAYELASPGSNPYVASQGSVAGMHASVVGGAIAYSTRYPAKEATRSGLFYLATRGSSGWGTQEVAPQDSPGAAPLAACDQSVYFSADLSHSILGDGWNGQEEESGASYCQSSEEALVGGAPVGYRDLFLHEGASGPYQLINVTPGSAMPGNAQLQDATADLGHVLFGESARLTPEAQEGYNLYAWAAGSVRLVTFLPDGQAVVGKLANGGNHTPTGNIYEGHALALAAVTHAMSASGEQVYFYAEHEGSVNLYLRVNAEQSQSAVDASGKVNGEQCIEPAKACTIQVDVSHGTGTSGGGVFWYASEDSNRVFFTDESRLTAGAGAAVGKPDLYEYNVETGTLTDITPEVLSGGAANARGYSGASEDGSYLYFVAKGKLTGAQANSEGATAVQGKPNLYLYHGGTLTFIATLKGEIGHSLEEEDTGDWQEESQHGIADWGTLSARVSPNGIYLGFASMNDLTAQATIAGKKLFLYDAADNQLSCASCNPNEGLVANAELPLPSPSSIDTPFGQPVYLARNVLNDGRVFFTTTGVLVSQDINSADDVYEYDEGRLSLISSGTGSGGAVFYDASPSGVDVFFVTAQGLVRSDADSNDSLYDARADGGFPSGPGEAVELEACHSEEECKPPVREAPAEQFAASSTLSAPGNLLAPQPKSEKPPAKKPTPRTLTRTQKLANALKECRKQPKKERQSCEASARKHYGTKTKAKSKKGGKR